MCGHIFCAFYKMSYTFSFKHTQILSWPPVYALYIFFCIIKAASSPLKVSAAKIAFPTNNVSLIKSKDLQFDNQEFWHGNDIDPTFKRLNFVVWCCSQCHAAPPLFLLDNELLSNFMNPDPSRYTNSWVMPYIYFCGIHVYVTQESIHKSELPYMPCCNYEMYLIITGAVHV